MLIAGAGPVGMTAALALAKKGVPVTVAGPRIDDSARGSTFHPPTLEILAKLEVYEEVLANGLRVDRFQYRERSAGVVADTGETPELLKRERRSAFWSGNGQLLGSDREKTPRSRWPPA